MASQANQQLVRFSSPGVAPSAQARTTAVTLGPGMFSAGCIATLEQKWGSVKGDGGLNAEWKAISVHHPSLPRGLDIIPMLPSPTFPTAQLLGTLRSLHPKFPLNPSLLLSRPLLLSRFSSPGASRVFPVRLSELAQGYM